MNLKTQKILAAKVAKVGVHKIAINPARLDDLKEAITKADISALIKSGAITIKQTKRPSRHRAVARHLQKKKGRQRGHGTRKGRKKARTPRKEQWVRKIRLLREQLHSYRDENKIERNIFVDLKQKAKGGFFRSKNHMIFYIKSNNLLKDGVKNE
ncbi:MAG: 50S ribosomal protein L19e [DPANN group archaeon]|nr:50S ribosomal protein L19e [DPANN group archaeon]